MAGGRPRTGSVRQKNGLWYASVAPARGQRRKEIAFGRDEQGARSWLRLAVAAQNAGEPLPPIPNLRRSAEPVAAAAVTDTFLGVPPARPVLGLDGARDCCTFA